jgi:hypothetical protein
MIDLVDGQAGIEGPLKPPRSRPCARADGGGDSDCGGEVVHSKCKRPSILRYEGRGQFSGGVLGSQAITRAAGKDKTSSVLS